MAPKRSPAPQISPAYTGRLAMAPVPSSRMPDEAMDPDAAYRFIHDELMLDGSSRLNLATFVTTGRCAAGRRPWYIRAKRAAARSPVRANCR